MGLASAYPVRLICRSIGLSRSSCYYRAWRSPAELFLRDERAHMAAEYPRYGDRRVTAELKRRGYRVHHKKVLRIMREENLLIEVKRYWRTSKPGVGSYPNLLKDLEVDYPDQVWCGDISYIKWDSVQSPSSSNLYPFLYLFSLSWFLLTAPLITLYQKSSQSEGLPLATYET